MRIAQHQSNRRSSSHPKNTPLHPCSLLILFANEQIDFEF